MLLQYLRQQPAGPDWDAHIKALFDLDAGTGLNADAVERLRKLLAPKEGAALLDRLRNLKCCDPAVGSGTFPVGLLHELVVLRRIVETAANGYVDPAHQPGTSWLHDVKEEIVQNCLFGVDIQQQAIEICRLRLWLTLVVDYDIGLDPFNAERQQFLQAISRISQLPNLEMNFHRGDSLLDMISNVPVRIEPGALGFLKKQVNELQKLSEQLHHAKKAERKKDLRIEILRRRLNLTERILGEQLEKFRQQDSAQAAWLFADMVPDRERRRRLAEEIDKAEKALGKVQADRKELEKLALRRIDKDFYPKLRRLEGADFDSPFNFAWQLDFAGIFRPERGGFDIIVGNPPFVTARNPTKRELYRERWKRVCSGKYLLICPFFDLSFGLLRPGGQLGFIVSNAFAKREFGKPLVEDFFPTVDLEKIVDCSGLLFPGHGTPTCIVFGRQEAPDANSPIRFVMTLPGGGDLRTPPEESSLWQAIASHHADADGLRPFPVPSQPGFRMAYEDTRIAVGDCDRTRVLRHPCVWSFFEWPVFDDLNRDSRPRLSNFLEGEVGVCTMTNADDVFLFSDDAARRWALSPERVPPYHQGEELRNWSGEAPCRILLPYGPDCELLSERALGRAERHYLSPFKTLLENRHSFGNKTFKELGRGWYEFERMNANKYSTPHFLTFPHIATHGHFVFVAESRVFGRHPQVIKLPRSRTDADHYLLASALNSSVSLFWLKQVCFNKGAGEDEERDRFEFGGAKVQELPLPDTVACTLGSEKNPSTETLTRLARECSDRGRQLPTLGMKKVLEKPGESYHAWNTSLLGYVVPDTRLGKPFTSSDKLRTAIDRIVELREAMRAEMIAPVRRRWTGSYTPPMESSLIRGQSCPMPTSRSRRDSGPSVSGRRRMVTSLEPCNSSRRTGRLPVGRCGRHGCDSSATTNTSAASSSRCTSVAGRSNGRSAIPGSAANRPTTPSFSTPSAGGCRKKRSGGWSFRKAAAPSLSRNGRPRSGPTRARICGVGGRRRNRTPSGRVEGSAGRIRGPRRSALDATFVAFAKSFKALVREQSVSENLPFARPWEEVERTHSVPAQAKKIRGRLNVPRERFWTTPAGEYRIVRFV